MDLGLEGKRAIVLGASKGLGFAIARALAGEGAELVVNSSNVRRCRAAAKAIAAETGAKAHDIAADMFEPDDMDRLAHEARRIMDAVDILVINHAGPVLGLAVDVDEAALHQHFNMMLASPIRLIKRLLPAMRERRWGRILSTGGLSMIQQLPNKVMDNILRGSMVGYTKALANEVAADGITVNIIVPGTFPTDRMMASTESNARLWGMTVDEVMAHRIENIPARRLGTLEEFGALAAFLVSEKAAYMTGSVWRSDGGATRSIL